MYWTCGRVFFDIMHLCNIKCNILIRGGLITKLTEGGNQFQVIFLERSRLSLAQLSFELEIGWEPTHILSKCLRDGNRLSGGLKTEPPYLLRRLADNHLAKEVTFQESRWRSRRQHPICSFGCSIRNDGCVRRLLFHQTWCCGRICSYSLTV